ncbi:heme exporter protein A [Vigna unguiculata]|uniref:Heme exporter protein A n=1 Tax=Vigna unguiculata TaxID=3917 RepID=A0A4D6M2F0_VIGUN|nr:heme exporter protein A [Vigna unguiculata]
MHRRAPFPRLLLHNVSCMRNAQQVLRHVNVSLHDGGALVLTGANGSGKTTFLRMLAGFSRPSAGQILWNGHDIQQSAIFHQYKLQLNWLSLKDAINDKFTVLNNVQWFEVLENKEGKAMAAVAVSYTHLDVYKRQGRGRQLSCYKLQLNWLSLKDAINDNFTVLNTVQWFEVLKNKEGKAMAAVELMGLGRLANEKPRMLSMGQRKRLQLARLLAIDRPIWLLDEPSVALDDEGVKLREYIIAEHRKHGGIVIVATHLHIEIEDSMVLKKSKALSIAHVAVSYTHLDVYKRQGRGRQLSCYKLQLNWLSLKDAINDNFTVLNTVQWFEVLKNKEGKAMAAVELMGLGRLANEKPRMLSMGQRKRLQLARLLAIDRPIWLLDEPSVALDDEGVKLRSGKTTFLRMLAGFSRPSAGQILWNGHDIQQSAIFHQYKLQLNWLSLKDAINDKFTVLNNVQWFEVLENKEGKAMAAVELMGLGRLANEKPRMLSMGQRKRLQLARLLAIDRPIWLLDEPSVALDDEGVKLLEYIIAEHRKHGGIVIVATHLHIEIEDSMVLKLPPRFPRRMTHVDMLDRADIT